MENIESSFHSLISNDFGSLHLSPSPWSWGTPSHNGFFSFSRSLHLISPSSKFLSRRFRTFLRFFLCSSVISSSSESKESIPWNEQPISMPHSRPVHLKLVYLSSGVVCLRLSWVYGPSHEDSLPICLRPEKTNNSLFLLSIHNANNNSPLKLEKLHERGCFWLVLLASFLWVLCLRNTSRTRRAPLPWLLPSWALASLSLLRLRPARFSSLKPKGNLPRFQRSRSCKGSLALWFSFCCLFPSPVL